MNSFCKKVKAFTLAEVAITLMVLALIASATIKITKSRSTQYLNSFMYYSAFTNLQKGIEELVAVGCDNGTAPNDLTKGYCAAQYSLPINGHNADSRGLCDRLVTEEFNTAGTVDCTRTISSETGQFDTAHANFITTNGMRFFNFASNAAGGPPIFYTVYIDIDGPKRNSVLNEDVMKFKVFTNGTFLPFIDSNGGNLTSYLSASVRYKDENGVRNWPKISVSYKEAACTAGKAQPIDSGYCGSYTADSRCSTYICELLINKPEFIFEH